MDREKEKKKKRKRQLQIWKVVNIHLKKLEVPKNILNATTKGYN